LAAADLKTLPTVLVTGFNAFPGAPVNPTEALIWTLDAERGAFAEICDLHPAVLDVDYRRLPKRLEELGAAVRPDIAVHFGLSGSAKGFAVERLARNVVGCEKPDNAGHVPVDPRIWPGDETLPSSLPVESIHAALDAACLPVEFSDDAGDYLCNYLFYLSRGHLCGAFAPEMAGFVHVPLVGAQPEEAAMDFDALSAGARIIIETCCRSWAASRA
jgi:pyroglutamyl-peptidase